MNEVNTCIRPVLMVLNISEPGFDAASVTDYCRYINSYMRQ